MMRNYIRMPIALVLCLIMGFNSVAQKLKQPHPNAVKLALDYVSKQPKTWNLTEQDLSAYFVQDSYHSEHNGVTHVYLIQQHKGIELYNAIINVNVLPNGEILYAGNRFLNNLAGVVNTTSPSLSPIQAVEAACKSLNVAIKTPLTIIDKKSDKEFLFAKGDNVLSDINVKLRYQRVGDKEVRLAWDLNIDQPDGQDHWSLRVDALNGKILDKNSWTSHCSFHPNAYHRTEDCDDNTPSVLGNKNSKIKPPSAPVVIGEGTYNVFALPVESPSHGNRSLVVSPADSIASPYGWHDINGVAGVEYKITRGNNVHAYLDVNGDNTSDGGEPNGGDNLLFDTKFFPDGEPDTNRHAATVNLFYVNNMMHDITFRYGFNEEAGNFQLKNYNGAAGANDFVRAEAQDASKATTPSTNNANFASPADGSSGRMQMFVWTRLGEKLLNISAPASLAGSYETGNASFGTPVTTTPISAQVVVVNDGSGNPSQGCKALLNTNLTGKIALVDRGNCFFTDKAYYAQQKGAVACIICNYEDAVINMGAGSALGNSVTIPSIFIKKSDCDRIKAAINSGLVLSINKPAASVGPDRLDGDFDNGIIAHEYGHGISSRLTGGRLNAGCLSAGEQSAGEGWSDFLALVVTTKATDKPTTNRGTGTYVNRQSNNGAGIRNYPYNTDNKINPLTYDRLIINPEVHDVGEVWTSALWDMYWAFVEAYGFDANLKNTQSGNGKALQLVIDGMKMQPCNPGFLDARDAILKADISNYGGANQCLIWEAFAKRGMGFNANQGLSSKYSDNTEGFEKLPQCVKQLKIKKEATELIKPGDAITYTIRVTNHKGMTATGVVVNDEIPLNTAYVAGSANRTVSVANGILIWNIGNLPTDSTIVLTYKVNSDVTKKSITQFTDDMEGSDKNWEVDQLKPSEVFWEQTDIFSRSGKKSFAIGYPPAGETDQILSLKTAVKITGVQPVLRFYHRYDTEPGFDAGIVQVNTGSANWENVQDLVFKNPYRGAVAYSTFVQPEVKGFWGKQDSFVASYIDLKNYLGKSVKFRFRFATDSTETGVGWFVDDVAIMDMYNYNSKARVTSTQKDTATAEVAARGTVVEPTVFTPTKEVNNKLQVKVFPNPTDDILNINIMGAEDSDVDIQIISADGRIMYQNKTKVFSVQESVIPLSTASYPSGIYITKVSTSDNIIIKKVVKH